MPAGGVAVGTPLAPLSIPVDHTLITAGAIATRDYQPVHHDASAARARGSKDVFMNIITSNGLVSRFVTDWSGPHAAIRSIAVRLGVPAYPGDVLTLTGEVVRCEQVDGACEVDIAVRGRNGLGDHISGTVSLIFPGAVGAAP